MTFMILYWTVFALSALETCHGNMTTAELDQFFPMLHLILAAGFTGICLRLDKLINKEAK